MGRTAADHLGGETYSLCPGMVLWGHLKTEQGDECKKMKIFSETLSHKYLLLYFPYPSWDVQRQLIKLN